MSEDSPLPPWSKPFELRLNSGAKFGDIVKLMVRDRLPEAQFNIATDQEFRGEPAMYVFGSLEGSDPWRDLQDLAQGYSCRVSFDSTTKTVEVRDEFP